MPPSPGAPPILMCFATWFENSPFACKLIPFNIFFSNVSYTSPLKIDRRQKYRRTHTLRVTTRSTISLLRMLRCARIWWIWWIWLVLSNNQETSEWALHPGLISTLSTLSSPCWIEDGITKLGGEDILLFLKVGFSWLISFYPQKIIFLLFFPLF